MIKREIGTEGLTEKYIRLEDVKTLITDAYTEGFKAGSSKELASHPDEYASFALMEDGNDS
jgi:hypothetical protein